MKLKRKTEYTPKRKINGEVIAKDTGKNGNNNGKKNGNKSSKGVLKITEKNGIKNGDSSDSKNTKLPPDKEIVQYLMQDIKWLEELHSTKKFSIDWILQCLEEVTMQCIGKKPVLVSNMWGQNQLKYIFRDQGAIKALETIARLQGHKLTELIKLDLSGTIEHEHVHRVELETTDERTAAVLGILSKCGKIQPPTKHLTAAEVVEVHSS